MTILDYRGFRLIALSLLPIEMKTIRYGSNTMGVTVLASDDDINVKMEVRDSIHNLSSPDFLLSQQNQTYFFQFFGLEMFLD